MVQKDYKIFFEDCGEKIKFRFGYFALFYSFFPFILPFLFAPSERISYLLYLFKDFDVLWPITAYLMLIMTIKLRDAVLNLFVNTVMPFDNDKNLNISQNLHYIFCQNKPTLIGFFIISLLAGIIEFYLSSKDPYFGVVNDIFTGIGAFTQWLAFLIMACVIIKLLILLRNLSRVQKSYDIRYFSELENVYKLESIPKKIIYCYLSVMVCLPFVVKYIFLVKGSWLIAGFFIFFMNLFGLLVVFGLPLYYVHSIIESAENSYNKQLDSSINGIEHKLSQGSDKGLDWIKYHILMHRFENLKQNKSSFYTRNLSGILPWGVLGNIVTIAIGILQLSNKS